MNKFLEFCEKEQSKEPDIIAAELKRRIAAKFGIGFGSAESYYQRYVTACGFKPIKRGHGFSAEKNERQAIKNAKMLEAANLLKAGCGDCPTTFFYAKLSRILEKEGISMRPKSLQITLYQLKFKLK